MQYTRDAAEKIIGDAAKADAETRERLTQTEIEDAAADVGIGRDAVRTVIARDTEATERSAVRRERIARSAKSAIKATLAVVLACAFLSSMVGVTVQRGVVAAHGAVVAQRHNVTLALDNRTLVTLALDTAINDGERAAVLERAERRISVAKRDYNAAVTTYNSAATGWFGRRAAEAERLPDSEPYADNVWR